jgi:hypothetical protein
MLCILLLFFGTNSHLLADISGVTLQVTSSGGGTKINGSGLVTLTANWTGDTPPFSAAFKSGGNTLGTESTTSNSATFQVSGAVLGHGSKAFDVTVIETSVPNAVEGSANGDQAVEVDLIAPQMTVSLNGSTFSNNPGNNEVIVQVTSDEVISAPTITVSPNSLGSTVDADPTNPANGQSFRFTITLTSAPGGNYTLTATGRDATQPASGANTGTANQTFSVNAAGPGAGSINSVMPGNPTNANSITLSGSTSTTMDSGRPVEVLEGGSVVATGNISGSTWTASINNVSEGNHTYTMRGYDNLGNFSSESAPYSVKVDRTQPANPVLNQPSSPTSLDAITITGTGAVESGTVTSLPVYVQVYDMNGTAIASAPAGGDGSFSIANVPLADGMNQFYVTAADATLPSGNQSGLSNRVTIIRDNSATSVNGVFISRPPVMASYSVPLDPNFNLGSGNYNLQVRFGEDMDRSQNPTITVQTAGGGTISNSSGNWIASDSFIGSINIPSSGGTTYDGVASLRVSGAKDVAGNVMTDYTDPAAFTIDSTPPVSSFDSEDTIFVSSSTPDISLSGSVTDNASGIEYVELVWQEFSGGAFASQSVPIQAASPSPWSYNWNVSTLNAGRYKLWISSGDRAKPTANVEAYQSKPYRIVIVDRQTPTVTRISLGNEALDINQMNGGAPPTIASAVTKLTAVISDMGNSGIDFDSANFSFTLRHDETNSNIMGNLTNNGSTTAFFDFSELTRNGTYTVSVTPADKGGNTGDTATRAFIIDKSGPAAGAFFPSNHSIANETQVAIAQDQVWATIADNDADYSASTIEVRYNGNLVGEQMVNASTTGLIWDLGGPTSALPLDQSADGRYDITVVPKDIYGNEGSVIRSYFNFDSVPPVIKTFEPAVNLKNASATWFGLDQSEISITVSDAPKDIIQYKDNMDNGLPATGFDFSTVQIPQDPNWYNSQGSGINTTTSSFTLTIAGVVSGPAAVSGDKFYQGRPAVPADTTAGVADVSVSVNIQDMVNEGQVIPNASMASYTLKFDYLNPQAPTITSPEPSNNKYCKNTVRIEGTASDRGSSPELMISAIEWSENGSDYKAFPAAGLPSASATFSTSFDITDRDDGTYTLDVRAVDLGNNRSDDSQLSFVVDRTPPKPPEMVVPLPDAVTNKRGQLFKWAGSTDGDHYLLQVADDSSFNNILNKQTNPGYTELVGQVTVMTENSFSVPKDGTYYWRVAAIETCIDGYNISSFSTTRRFTIDTVKPLVVEVQPAPSSGNKITTGMVTFTIRFSEIVDTTIPPSVRLTSNGGQVMSIEMVSYKEDTWIGTTVVPKNDSSLYDGTAIISIEGSKDVAGNQMANDSSNSVVINTGPAFTTKIFSNPANVYEIMVVTKSSEALQSPPTCTVQQSSARTPVIMNFLKERFYAGSYKIDVESPGKAYIDVSGTDLHGMVGYGSVEFTVAELSDELRLNITSNSGKASLKAAEGSAFVKSPIFMLDRDDLEPPFSNEIRASVMPDTVQRPKNGSELVPLMGLEEIGPANLQLKKRLLYTADVKDLRSKVPADKIGIYRLNADGYWVYQGGELKDGQISAQLTGLGRLALMADMTPPSLGNHSPQNMDELEDPTPEISGRLLDYGSGVRKDSVKLLIDDMEIPGVSLNMDGSFKYKVKLPMKKGKHEIAVQATDLAGNELRNSFWVTTLGQFAVDEFMPYPNPTTGNHMYFNYNFNQTAERVRLKIYDTAGHLVADHDTFDFASTKQGRFRWDLRNNSGRVVANGAYFYKIEITKNGRTFKKRGTFAVMR